MQVAQEVELFQLSDIEQVRLEMSKLKKEIQNTRKGLFVRHETLLQMYNNAKDEIEQLRSIIQDIKTSKSELEPKCEMFFI